MGIGRDIAYALGLAATSPVWATSMLRTGKWRTDWAGRLGRGATAPANASPTPPRKPRVLLHAVSVGEVNLIRQLVTDLDARGLDVVITATTNTGFDRATHLYADHHLVLRYPLDFTAAVRRFLHAIRPDVVALTELEVWPNFVEECNRQGVPVCVINGRLSERSLHRYKLIRPWLRSTFASLAAAAVQTPAYAERFIQMGVPADRVHVLDTMKWDTAVIADHVPGADTLAAEMGIDLNRPLVVLGSTGPNEELPLTQALRAACGDDLQILVVPRKPERFNEVAAALPNCIRRTQPRPPHLTPHAPTHLLDTLGELRKAYALADVVIVGRSFNRWGGSDPIEPIGLGKPTILGPDHQNFADAVTALQQGQGIELASDIEDAAKRTASLLRDPPRAARLAERGRAVILSRQGATRRHVDLITRLLAAAKPQT